VYEITKVFRNEGIDHDHNPEFTMFEAQIAYEDYRYGMDLIEEIFENTAKEVLGKTVMSFGGQDIDVRRPWKRMSMVEAINTCAGIDVLAWQNKEEALATLNASSIPRVKLEEAARLGTLGEMIAFAFEELVEEKLIQPTIIYDYPVEVSPLAKRAKDPRFVERFEYFAFGSELGNNYSELNDAKDLRERFIEEKKKKEAGFEEAHQSDEDYVVAIEHGFPPTCGLSIGIDRMVMLYTGAENIKEIIPFPTLRPKTTTEEDEQ
jgi:lysyl-tRNA synthetase class 2